MLTEDDRVEISAMIQTAVAQVYGTVFADIRAEHRAALAGIRDRLDTIEQRIGGMDDKFAIGMANLEDVTNQILDILRAR